MADELAGAYHNLENAIHKVASLEGWPGLITDWAVIAAVQQYDDQGGDLTAVSRIRPEGGKRIPYYRVMGLLDYALTGMRNDIADEASLGGDDD